MGSINFRQALEPNQKVVIPDGSEETMIVEIDEEGTIDLSEQKPKPPRG